MTGPLPLWKPVPPDAVGWNAVLIRRRSLGHPANLSTAEFGTFGRVQRRPFAV